MLDGKAVRNGLSAVGTLTTLYRLKTHDVSERVVPFTRGVSVARNGLLYHLERLNKTADLVGALRTATLAIFPGLTLAPGIEVCESLPGLTLTAYAVA